MEEQNLINRFTSHPPKCNQPERYQNIRSMALTFAMYIAAHTPESREQSLAITKLEEVVFWANAAIARNENVVPAN